MCQPPAPRKRTPFPFMRCSCYGEDRDTVSPSPSCISSATSLLSALPWALSVPFSLHCISFSSKNRSFNLGRTINWDEKKKIQSMGRHFGFSIRHEVIGNATAVSLLGIPAHSSFWASGKSWTQEGQIQLLQFHSTSPVSFKHVTEQWHKEQSPLLWFH